MSGQMTFNVEDGDLSEDMNVFHFTGETAILKKKLQQYPYFYVFSGLKIL